METSWLPGGTLEAPKARLLKWGMCEEHKGLVEDTWTLCTENARWTAVRTPRVQAGLRAAPVLLGRRPVIWLWGTDLYPWESLLLFLKKAMWAFELQVTYINDF